MPRTSDLVREEALARRACVFTWAGSGGTVGGDSGLKGLQHLHPCGMKWRTLRVTTCNPCSSAVGCDHQGQRLMAIFR